MRPPAERRLLQRSANRVGDPVRLRRRFQLDRGSELLGGTRPEGPIGCGGWSSRRTLYGGDQRLVGPPDRLRPGVDAAKIRAFFVAPAWARRGVGSAILDACVAAALHAGFQDLELMATLPGVPMYAARGFVAVENVQDVLPDGTRIDFVRMRRPAVVSGGGA
ncbi:MAG: GNAT family N-acetyltransferase [Gemmatimonadaceae bacterium]